MWQERYVSCHEIVDSILDGAKQTENRKIKSITEHIGIAGYKCPQKFRSSFKKDQTGKFKGL